MYLGDLRALLDSMPLPALMVDRDERIAASNALARTLLGQQIDGRNYVTMLRQPATLDAIESTLRDRQPRSARYLTNDGAQDITYRVTCRFVDAQIDPDTAGVLVSFEDISHLESASQMRRDFVANVSHELRTPLTALMGFIETLLGSARDDPAARERFLKIMAGEAGRMNRLVGDLLSLSRVEGDERVRPKGQVNIGDLIGSVIRSLKPLADEGKVEITLEAPDDPVVITGDSDQLNQVFTNLIENALKYGGSGGVVTVRMVQSERDPTLRAPGVRIQVIDKGPGIDPVHLPRLTERFYRADSHRSRQLGGTGLGLAIVKHIINRHRGRLRVESDLGQGSVFTVILPISQEITPTSAQ
ncbi:Adaptive-response sensory-kinase SasA (plasmid) [Pseudoseohaeicola sp. NH-UV-7]|uniref:ATP-binding protein n=1 Tax=unclassified Sulfitobacter TaxID=196795 RepID=UPI000E0C036B|nr:ATP-binding protein [Sulfitobacter sp. JL08]AXI54819.1 two-component sensor histidine kinase [Sulfitobacter sp. JL08]